MNASANPLAGPAPLSDFARFVITASTMLATVMQGVDGTIANVALPYMQGSMSASQEQIDWVLTSYIVASAIMTSPTGYLAARFGRMRFFVTAIVGFTVTSVLCGMSQTLGEVVFCRVLQGMAGACVIPLSQVVLLDIYPGNQRNGAMGIWTMGVMVGPILGPTIGGFLTAHYTWRAVFYVNVPFGIIASLGLLFCLPETASNRRLRLDWLGFGALSLGVGLLQTVLDRGETLDWFSSKEIIVETILSGVGFYIFFVQLFFAPKPFLSPRLFKDINFDIALVLIFLVAGTVYATLALLAPYVENLMNFPVYTAGIVMAPRGFGSMLSAWLFGRLAGRVSARKLVIIGILIVSWVQYSMMDWTPDVSATWIASLGFIQGIGITLITVPISTIGYSTLAADLRTEATGVFNLFRTMGSAIVISVTGTALAQNMQINHADISSAINPFNRALANGAAAQFWNPFHQGSAMLLDSQIVRQGSIIAYSDDFKLMMLMLMGMMPLLLLIRKPALITPMQANEHPAE